MLGKYTINIVGLFEDATIGSISNDQGIYFVYSGFQNQLKVLIYIGETDDIRDRISAHEKKNNCKKHLNHEEKLYYAYSDTKNFDASTRRYICAALIFTHKPPENLDYVDNYPFSPINIIIPNEKYLLKTNFIVPS